MNKVEEFIESGILEVYVLGQATPSEQAEVERMASFHQEVRDEIETISIALERYAEANAIEPNPTVHTFLNATIDYMERMKGGEAPSFPPMLHKGSRIEDFTPWLNRQDLIPNADYEAAHASIIGHTAEATTAIVWLRYGAPPETHTDEQERFLVLEGTCDIIVGEKVNSLQPGDVFFIPLHIQHIVKVTSSYPCKIILQRAAA